MKNKKNQHPITLPECACELFNFTGEETLELQAAENVLVILKDKMTAIELIRAIDVLSEIASDLTVVLAKACGVCYNCGDETCGGKDCPAQRVENCSLCHDLLDESQNIHLPDFVLEEAGIPKDAKLEAYIDGESGEITVVESDVQHDISDVPPGILSVLAQSGICLAELDELIMLAEIVYGKN
jgi:hypothetical protein